MVEVIGIDVGEGSTKIVVLKQGSSPEYFHVESNVEKINEVVSNYSTNKKCKITGNGTVSIDQASPVSISSSYFTGSNYYLTNLGLSTVYGERRNFEKILVVDLGIVAHFTLFE